MIFTKFDKSDIVSGRINSVSSGFFSGEELTYNQHNLKADPIIVAPDENPLEISNQHYYLNVNNSNDELLFSIAYGDYDNSGSSAYNTTSTATENIVPTLTYETKVIYSQYKNTLLQPGDELFSFVSGSVNNTPIDGKSIFVLNFASNRVKDQLDPGQLQLNFKVNNIDGSENSPDVISLIDDSFLLSKKQSVYNLIRGKIINGVPVYEPISEVDNRPRYEGIGLFYPASGVVVLNAEVLNSIINCITYTTGEPPVTTSSEFREHYSIEQYSDTNEAYRNWTYKLFESINAVNSDESETEAGSFTVVYPYKDYKMSVRKCEFVPSTTYFIRVKNTEYNYSNNPTYVSDGTDGKLRGTIIYQELIENPRTYLTTIGLYNENNELLAIGKLSQPAIKSFDTELLLKCKIDF